MTARPVLGSLRFWLIEEGKYIDEPKGHFRDKAEVAKFARGRKHSCVWEPWLDGGKIPWTYKEKR